MADVVGVRGGREHESGLEACPVGKSMSGVEVVEVDNEFSEEGGEEDLGVSSAVVSEAFGGEVDGVRGVGPGYVEVGPKGG